MPSEPGSPGGPCGPGGQKHELRLFVQPQTFRWQREQLEWRIR